MCRERNTQYGIRNTRYVTRIAYCVFRVLLVLLAALALAAVGLLWWFSVDLPSPDRLGTYIADSTGIESHTFVPLSDIAEPLRWATIATEDKDFYNRSWDIHPSAVLRAIWTTLRNPNAMDSYTIPQRLVANLMTLSGKRVSSPVRQRLRELALTVWLTYHYTPDRILELYLNSIPYGPSLYGVESAALFYYGKHASDLSLAECVMLVAIAQEPDGDLEFARRRQAIVLDLMVEEGYITPEEAARAKIVH